MAGDRSATRPWRSSSGGWRIAAGRQAPAALGPVPVLDEAVLLVSELTTNAVIHTASGDGGAFDVAVRRYPSAVRIEVHDAGSRRVPVPRPEDFMAEEGRGLDLVNLVADRWGHNGDQGSRSVFFELCW